MQWCSLKKPFYKLILLLIRGLLAASALEASWTEKRVTRRKRKSK